jgi:hypothetical protein
MAFKVGDYIIPKYLMRERSYKERFFNRRIVQETKTEYIISYNRESLESPQLKVPMNKLKANKYFIKVTDAIRVLYE